MKPSLKINQCEVQNRNYLSNDQVLKIVRTPAGTDNHKNTTHKT